MLGVIALITTTSISTLTSKQISVSYTTASIRSVQNRLQESIKISQLGEKILNRRVKRRRTLSDSEKDNEDVRDSPRYKKRDIRFFPR